MPHKTPADDDDGYPINFTKVNELLKLACAYEVEAHSCRKVGASLASCVMLGASVEAFLIAVINMFFYEARKTPVVIKKKLKLENLLRWDLSQLLDVAKDAKWLPGELTLEPAIDHRTVKASVPTGKIREVRNLVHPGRCVREGKDTEITKDELDTLYATCHAAYLCLRQRIVRELS